MCVRVRTGMGRSHYWPKFIFCFLKDDREGKRREELCNYKAVAREEKLVLTALRESIIKMHKLNYERKVRVTIISEF